MTRDERLRADWDRWQSLEWSTPTDRREALELAEKSLTKALEALAELGRVGGGYLLTDEAGEPLVDLVALAQVRDQIAAAKVTAKTPKGRAPDMPRRFLVRRLARDFKLETGLAPSVTHDPYTETRSGRFVNYAIGRAAAIGVTLTPHQIEHVLASPPE